MPAAEALLDTLLTKLKQLELAVKTQQADFTGVRVADCLKAVANLELIQVGVLGGRGRVCSWQNWI